MADQETALRELLAKGSDASFLREMIGFAAQRLMELETEGLTGAAHGERSADRRVRRNGYSPAPLLSPAMVRSGLGMEPGDR